MKEKEYKDYLISCGFTEAEIKQKLIEKEVMKKLYFSGEPKEYVDKSTSTYKRCMKKMEKEIQSFCGFIEKK